MNVSSVSSAAYQAPDAQAASKKAPAQTTSTPAAAPAAPKDSDGDHDGGKSASSGKLDVRA